MGQRLCIFSDLRYRFQVPETGCSNRGISLGTQVQRSGQLLIPAPSPLPSLPEPARQQPYVQPPQAPILLCTLFWTGNNLDVLSSEDIRDLCFELQLRELKTTTSNILAISLLDFPLFFDCDTVFTEASVLLDTFHSWLPHSAKTHLFLVGQLKCHFFQEALSPS